MSLFVLALALAGCQLAGQRTFAGFTLQGKSYSAEPAQLAASGDSHSRLQTGGATEVTMELVFASGSQVEHGTFPVSSGQIQVPQGVFRVEAGQVTVQNVQDGLVRGNYDLTGRLGGQGPVQKVVGSFDATLSR